MKAQWQQLSARFKALPARERLLLPAAVCFAIVMLGYLLLIEPAQKAHRALQQRHSLESHELTVAQAQLALLQTKLQNPDAALHAQLDSLRTQTRDVDEQFQQLQGSLVPAHDMSRWLEGVLQAQRGLQLVGLRSLPASSVGALVDTHTPTTTTTTTASTTSPTTPDASVKDAWLYRHGVELSVRGSYPELLAYLHALERMPKRVYWGELKLNAQDSPSVVMTLTVYTLSVQKAWWVI